MYYNLPAPPSTTTFSTTTSTSTTTTSTTTTSTTTTSTTTTSTTSTTSLPALSLSATSPASGTLWIDVNNLTPNGTALVRLVDPNATVLVNSNFGANSSGFLHVSYQPAPGYPAGLYQWTVTDNATGRVGNASYNLS